MRLYVSRLGYDTEENHVTPGRAAELVLGVTVYVREETGADPVLPSFQEDGPFAVENVHHVRPRVTVAGGAAAIPKRKPAQHPTLPTFPRSDEDLFQYILCTWSDNKCRFLFIHITDKHVKTSLIDIQPGFAVEFHSPAAQNTREYP